MRLICRRSPKGLSHVQLPERGVDIDELERSKTTRFKPPEKSLAEADELISIIEQSRLTNALGQNETKFEHKRQINELV
jgi:hypothetical protein